MFGQMTEKIRQEKNMYYVKMPRYSQRFQLSKCLNILKLYTLKTLLSKN